MKPAVHALKTVKSEYLELAYPGVLAMPLVAWRCGDGEWTAVTTASKDVEVPVQLLTRVSGDELEARLECFGACTFREIRTKGAWDALAREVARTSGLVAKHPALGSRYNRYRFFVRQWVADDPRSPVQTDWSAAALRHRMRQEDSRTIVFAFGIDPNEVDLGGKYFWSVGASSEVKELMRANPSVAQFRWLNLRTYKYAIPNLGL